ncbi:MAG TPA: peptidase domain-containing ABC transporter [Candidatus Nanopelagicales bacterium]|nr:peptidase domain-containing ABC transporter [Candidatus Nanopelagicales bacterium]
MPDALLDDPLRGQPAFALLPTETRGLLVASLEPVTYAFGEVIVREGDPADSFYVITDGTARVLRRGESGDEVALRSLHAGDTFGEAALLGGDERRTATVRASGPVGALRMHRAVFAALVRSHPQVRDSFESLARLRDLWDFFRVHTEFAALSDVGLATLASRLEPVEARAGDVLIREGDPPGPMYVVREGRLRVWVHGVGDVAFLRSGDYVGEASLFQDARRNATVESVGESSLLRLPVDAFRDLAGREPEFRARIEERLHRYEFRTRARVPLDFAEEILPADAEAAPPPSPADSPDPVPDSADAGALPQQRRPRRSRRFPLVYQLDEMDCGAASLAMVCRAHGRPVGIARIRELARTATEGTTLAGITRAATALGLDARSVRVSVSRLDELPLPAIVHWQGNHWIVLHEVTPTHVRVADPARGLLRMTREEFLGGWSGYAAVMTPTAAFDDAPEDRVDASWLLPFVRPHRRALVAAVVLALVAACLELVLPLLARYVVDDVVGQDDLALLRTALPVALVALAALVAASAVERLLVARVAVDLDLSTLDFLTGRLLALPATYFAARRSGDIERRLGGASQVRAFLVDSGLQVLTAAATVLASVVLMLVYDVPLTVVFLLAAALYVVAARVASKRLRPLAESLEESYEQYSASQLDAVRGIETVKALAAEESLQALMLQRFQSLSDRVLRSQFLVLAYDSSLRLITVASYVAVLVLGAAQVVSGSMTLGEYVAFLLLVGLATAPLLVVLGLWDKFQRVQVLLGRLDDVLVQEPEQGHDRTGLVPVRSLQGSIALRGVGFRYGGPTAPAILDGVDLVFEPGTLTALVGRSGSGKTTLAKMLAGLLLPTEGTITYDGVDLLVLDHRTLRRQIGFVLQDTHLFDDSIAANIAYGEAVPDSSALRLAAERAAALEFVERLPLGFATKVGESGMALSGGQKQRLAIARALYHDPPVLLLDEATSALDTESEKAVTRSLGLLLADRTAVVIAHRLSTIRDADNIVVLDRGRVVEQGTHDELIRHEGLYFYLSSQQLEQ